MSISHQMKKSFRNLQQTIPVRNTSLHFFAFLTVAAAAALFVFLVFGCGESAGETLNVDDDAEEGGDGSDGWPFNRIQDAINASEDGDTVRVWDGTYYENVVVNTTLNLVGNGSHLTIMESSGDSYAMHLNADFVNVSGFNLTGTGFVPITISSDYNRIDNCEVLGGISVLSSTRNIFYNNSLYGRGISMSSVYGSNSTFDHTIDASNTLDGMPIIYVRDTREEDITEGFGQLILYNCSDVAVMEHHVSVHGNEILVAYSTNVSVRDNHFINGRYGVKLLNSLNCTIENNTIGGTVYACIDIRKTNNSAILNNNLIDLPYEGISISGSYHNIVDGNTCTGTNRSYGRGIHYSFSANNTITNNTCTGRSLGIFMSRVYDSLIARNEFSENGECGIRAQECRNLTIKDNECHNNTSESYWDEGILVWYCYDSLVVNNNCSGNDAGIYLQENVRVNATGNTCTGNRYGIVVNYGSEPDILHVRHTISRNSCDDNEEDGIWLREVGNFTLENNTFRYNGKHGIHLDESNDITIENNMVLGNNESGVHLDESDRNNLTGNLISNNLVGVSLEHTSGNNSIRGNDIQGNHEYGVNISDYWAPVDINASQNYWGSNTGPYHPVYNPGGKGDAISDNVLFEPWLNENGTLNWNLTSVSGNDDSNDNLGYFLFGLSILLLGNLVILTYLAHTSEAMRYRLLRLFLPLYSRLNEKTIDRDIRQQNIRGRIYQYIKDNPGTHFSGIKDEVNCGYGTTIYHLSVLQREGYLRSAISGRRKVFWTKMEFPGRASAALTDVQRDMIELLELKGTLSRSEIMEELDLSGSTLHENVKKLVDVGKLVEEKRDGTGYCSLCSSD